MVAKVARKAASTYETQGIDPEPLGQANRRGNKGVTWTQLGLHVNAVES